MKNESENKKHKLASKMVGNETHRPYSERMKGVPNVESLRKVQSYKRFRH